MLEKHYALYFKDMSCVIHNPFLCKLMCVKMEARSFLVAWKQTFVQCIPNEDRNLANNIEFQVKDRKSMEEIYYKFNATALEHANYDKAMSKENCRAVRRKRLRKWNSLVS